jgi:hypothetical protein
MAFAVERAASSSGAAAVSSPGKGGELTRVEGIWASEDSPGTSMSTGADGSRLKNSIVKEIFFQT